MIINYSVYILLYWLLWNVFNKKFESKIKGKQLSFDWKSEDKERIFFVNEKSENIECKEWRDLSLREVGWLLPFLVECVRG